MNLNHRDDLPTYVERGGECVYCPPGIATGVRMFAFMLRGDAAAMQEMYDRYLNRPSNGAVHFEPAGELFVLNFTTLDHVGAYTPPDDARGFFEESEMAIWTLAYDRVSDTYSTFVPYMVVDKGAAMAMGREVYGFPKQLGWVDMPPRHGPFDHFGLDVLGVTEWGPTQQFLRRPLLDIVRTDNGTASDPGAVQDAVTGSAAPLQHVLGSQLQLVLAMAEMAHHDPGLAGMVRAPGSHAGDRHDADGPDLLDALELLADETLPMVFLKQIRDGNTPTLACYQAVQRADFEVTQYRGASPLEGTYEIRLTDLANEPIRTDLGLPAGPLHPVGAFVVDFDFTLSVATEISRFDQVPPVQVRARA